MKRSLLPGLLLGAAALAWVGCEANSTEPTSDITNPPALGDTSNAGGAAPEADTSSNSAPSSPGGSAGESSDLAPELDSLLVDGVEIGLKPKFDPKTTRYSVLASEPAGDLRVEVGAPAALHIEIDGVEAAAGMPVALPGVTPGSEFAIEVANEAGDSRTYRVSYLPADFPNFHVAARESTASKDPIYLSARSRGSYYVVKLDNNAVPLFYRKTEQLSFDFKKHATGELSYAEFVPGTTRAEHIVLDDTYNEVDRVTTVGLVDTDEHEFVIQPNGNYIVIAYEPMVRDLTEFGLGPDEHIRDGIWQELSRDHEVLFQWNSWSHMRFDETVYLEKDSRDYAHMNSLFVDDDGNWIVSSRGMAQILKIDRVTGKVIWKLGGVQNQFTFVNDPFGGLCGQHTASILDNGHLLLFDNGQYCYPAMPERGELTRIVEYAIDEAAMTAELVWSYSREGAYTQSQGSAQRLANGNTFIGWGAGTRYLATEVDPDGAIVFELQGRAASGYTQSYRARRFPD